jgi:8-oxo-dGTP pyrophosphatase MutT (NUDIX family)
MNPSEKAVSIFLGDRVILLSGRKPERTGKNDLTFTGNSSSGFESVYKQFEASGSCRKLWIWPVHRVPDWERNFFSLFKTVEAAGGVVRNEKDELLFIFRFGKWDLPKGKFSGPGETPEQAALREVREETGLRKIRVSRDLSPTYHIYYEKGIRILKKTQWYEMTASSARPLKAQAEEGIEKIRWVPRDKLDRILDNTYASLKELISGFM